MEFENPTALSLTIILAAIIFFGLIFSTFVFLINDNIKRLNYRARHVDEALDTIMLFMKISIITQSGINPSSVILKYEKNGYHDLERIVKEEMEKNNRVTKYDKFNISATDPFIGGRDS